MDGPDSIQFQEVRYRMSNYKHAFTRHKTREVQVGKLAVGGDNPIWVQSMTTPDTHNLEATVKEIQRLEEAGCEMVRRRPYPSPKTRRSSAKSRNALACP